MKKIVLVLLLLGIAAAVGQVNNPTIIAAITGGTIDGAVIGGTTPAAITGTTITSKPGSANQGFTVFGAGADAADSATLADDGSNNFKLAAANTGGLQLVAGGNVIIDSATSGALYLNQQHAAPVNIGIAGQLVTVAGSFTTNFWVPKTLYSAAGTALPSCNAGAKGEIAVVSDASGPTYNATYTSGGAVTVPVICDGTNWKTH